MTHSKLRQSAKGQQRSESAAKRSGNAAKNGSAAVAGESGTETFETLTDIVKRTGNLLKMQAERLQTDDGYQVIDPRTVASTLQKVSKAATADPVSIIDQQIDLWSDLTRLWQRTAARTLFNLPVDPVIEPSKRDKRFKHEAWTGNPYFDFMKQYYLLMSRHLQSTIVDLKGVDPQTHHKAQFYTRQFINALAPTNFAATNPAVISAAIESRGENLIRGYRNFLADLERGGGRLSMKMADHDAFRFGENIAISPGKVIFQNELMQLIQYAPATAKVHRRPLLIVAPWINKFYILDLKPKNSFIKWCVDQGHTVFVISWVNPGAELADKGFADYLLDGPMAAIKAIEHATGETEINTIGYCIGGTLMASSLAYMAAINDQRIASTTLFTTLLDFSDVGDISVFIDEPQLELADNT